MTEQGPLKQGVIDNLAIRATALEKAVEVSIAKGDADGRTVLRRAVAFEKFLNGTLRSEDTSDSHGDSIGPSLS